MTLMTLALAALMAQQPAATGQPRDLQTLVGPEAQWKQLVDVAIRTGIREDVPPVPLGADGSTRHGIALDPFRLIAAAARARAAGGEAVTPQVADAIRREQFIVVAYPLSCDGQTRTPRRIDVWGRGQQPIARRGELVADADLRRVLPWRTLPGGAVAGIFAGSSLPAGGEVVLTYDGPACPGGSYTVSLPVKAGPPTKLVNVPPRWPMGVMGTPATGRVEVRVRATIDLEGVPTNLEVVSAPSEFNLAATAAVRRWRYAPMTLNGAPSYAPIVMTVVVTFSGSRR